MTHQIDTTLLDIAAWKVDLSRFAQSHEKRAFVSPQGDPAAGGMPPGMDPAAMGGGMPPGMDPAAMGGGMPPMDPAMMGGGMPPAPGIDPAMIQQIVQATLQAQGGGAAGAGAASPAGPAGVGQKMKIEPTLVYMKLGRLEKLMLHMYEQLGWPLPPDTLNDDLMIQQAAGQAPAAGGAGGATPPADPAAAGPQAIPGIGQSPAIQPIAPVGGEKTAEHLLQELSRGDNLLHTASVLDRLLSAA